MKTIREITTKECPWLANDIPEGTEVYLCLHPTYGATKETALTLSPNGDYPFFELPKNSYK